MWTIEYLDDGEWVQLYTSESIYDVMERAEDEERAYGNSYEFRVRPATEKSIGL